MQYILSSQTALISILSMTYCLIIRGLDSEEQTWKPPESSAAPNSFSKEMSVWSDTGGLNILQEVLLSLLVYLLSVWFRFYFHPLCAHYAEYRVVITESGIKRPQLRNVKLTSASLTLSLLTFHVCFVLYTEKGSGMQMFCSLSFYYYVQNSNSRSWLFFLYYLHCYFDAVHF